MGNSTHGRKLLPVPPSLEDGLRARGLRPVMPVIPDTHRWTLPSVRSTTMTFVASTIPGDPSVTVTFDFLGGKPRRMSIDALLAWVDVMTGGRR